MSNRRFRWFTVMLVPESEGESIQFRVPMIALKMVAALGVLISFALVAFMGSYFLMLQDRVELMHLRQVNRIQRDRLVELEASYAGLTEAWSRVEELDLQVREMLGLDKEYPMSGQTWPGYASDFDPALSDWDGIGGLTAKYPDPALNDMLALEARASSLAGLLEDTEGSLHDVRSSVAEHQELLRSKPSLWPVTGLLTSPFGYRRSPFGTGYEFHRGVDIAAPRGTPVLATADGVVTFVGWLSSYGITIRIDHGHGVETLSAHLGKSTVEAGQRVNRGETIGLVGSTGRSTGPHLHYEVHIDGRPVNPRPYLVSRQP